MAQFISHKALLQCITGTFTLQCRHNSFLSGPVTDTTALFHKANCVSEDIERFTVCFVLEFYCATHAYELYYSLRDTQWHDFIMNRGIFF
jgi:hypothetical protein